MVEFNFPDFPLLETARLELKKPGLLYAPFILKLRSSPEVMLHIGKELMKNEEEARELLTNMQDRYDEQTGINWVICLKGTDIPIGIIGLWRIMREHYRAEIGYTLHTDYWRQGYISEALKVVMEFGFKQLNLHTVEGNTSTGNKGSIKVLENEGFVLEGHFRQNYYFKGVFSDTLTFGKINPKNK